MSSSFGTASNGLRHAASVIERYAALVPKASDEMRRKLRTAKKEVARKAEEKAKKVGSS